MRKPIKVEQNIYDRLDEMKFYRETFNDVVVRLLKLYDMMHEVSRTLGPQHPINERKGIFVEDKGTPH